MIPQIMHFFEESVLLLYLLDDKTSEKSHRLSLKKNLSHIYTQAKTALITHNSLATVNQSTQQLSNCIKILRNVQQQT